MTANYNVWNEMFKNSQKMMNEWISALPKFASENVGPTPDGFDFTNYQDWVNFQQKWFKDWQEMMRNMSPDGAMFGGPYESWMKMMDTYNPFDTSKLMAPFTREVFEKMQNSQKLYLGAYEQWEKFNNQVLKPGAENYKENVDQLVDQFNKMFMNNLVPLLPKEFQGLMVDTQSYFNTYFNSLENILGPWSYAYKNIGDIAMKSMFEDPMYLSDTLKEWKQAYDKTFGILVKSPVVGSSREMLEQNNKAIDAMIDMLVTISEFMTKASSVGYKYSKEAFASYIESIEQGGQPKTFKEFYDMWSKYVEDAIEDYFYTDEFSKLIAKTADSAMIFKIEYDKVIEKALSDLPIVTMSEVDNVYKNVYELRRELRSLKKEVEELKEAINKNK